jgi:hypothetical protein
MAIGFSRSLRIRDCLTCLPIERFETCVVGTTVLSASLGLGEAVYRLAFSDFDGATDRLPIEAQFGLISGYLATKAAGHVYKRRKQATASRLHLISDRDRRIRHALGAIFPLAHPSKNQQSIRVVREEVDRIESTLKDAVASLESA